jgi:hypothetical protein
MEFTLLDLQNVLRTIGRGVVFYSNQWVSGDISLTHLGDTEGEIVATPTSTISALTTPELTGDDEIVAFVLGAGMNVTIPLYVADPSVRAILSPTGNASGGTSRRIPVLERTLVIFPEELFFDEAGSREYETLAYTSGGGWTVGGTALTARQEALLGQAVWLWRGYFMPAPITFRHDNAGKAVENVTFKAMHDFTKPENHQVYTIGDPADAGIDIDV